MSKLATGPVLTGRDWRLFRISCFGFGPCRLNLTATPFGIGFAPSSPSHLPSMPKVCSLSRYGRILAPAGRGSDLAAQIFNDFGEPISMRDGLRFSNGDCSRPEFSRWTGSVHSISSNGGRLARTAQALGAVHFTVGRCLLLASGGFGRVSSGARHPAPERRCGGACDHHLNRSRPLRSDRDDPGRVRDSCPGPESPAPRSEILTAAPSRHDHDRADGTMSLDVDAGLDYVV